MHTYWFQSISELGLKKGDHPSRTCYHKAIEILISTEWQRNWGNALDQKWQRLHVVLFAYWKVSSMHELQLTKAEPKLIRLVEPLNTKQLIWLRLSFIYPFCYWFSILIILIWSDHYQKGGRIGFPLKPPSDINVLVSYTIWEHHPYYWHQ